MKRSTTVAWIIVMLMSVGGYLSLRRWGHGGIDELTRVTASIAAAGTTYFLYIYFGRIMDKGPKEN